MRFLNHRLSALTFVASLALAACGGGAAAPSSAPPSSAAPPASSAPASGAAASKPASSSAASSKPAASRSASAKPAASASTAGSTAAPIKLSSSFSEIYEGQIPVWVTQDGGIFKKNGLDVQQTYIASSTGLAALLSGQTQVSQGGGSEALSAAAGGADLVIIGNIVPVYPYVLEAAAKIKTVQDLKGTTIGVSKPGSASDIATRIALKKEGLNADKDVKILAVGSSQNRTAALQSGQIQAGLDQPPSSFELEKQGLHPLFDLASLNLPTVNNGIVVQRSWLNSHRAEAQKYIDSIVEGIARTKKDRAFAAQVLTKEMKLSNADYATKTVAFAADHLFASTPTTKPDDFKDAIDELSIKNPKVKDFDVSKIIDNSLVESAIKRGLDK